MILGLLSVALALPPGLDPAQVEDARAWEQRSRALLEGPPGCVELRGQVEVRVVLFRPGGWLSKGEKSELKTAGSFQGRLEAGTWTRLETTWDLDEKQKDRLNLDRLRPIVGKLPADEKERGGVAVSQRDGGTEVDISGQSAEAVGMLDKIIAEIDPEVTTAWSLWDEAEGAVVLEQQVPLSRGQDELRIQTRFPGGGPPTALDAVFPPSIRVGDGLVKASLRDAQLHLRGRQGGLGLLPTDEGLSVIIGVLGYTLGFEQRLRYEAARACP